MVGGAASWPQQARLVVKRDLPGFLAYLRELTSGREKA
jgi:hypothetical protein